MKRTKGQTWTTRDGRVIPIADLGDKHLVNILYVIEESLSLFQPERETQAPQHKATFPASLHQIFLSGGKLPDGGEVTKMDQSEYYTEYTVRYAAHPKYVQAYRYSLAQRPYEYPKKPHQLATPVKKNMSADRLALYGPLVIEAIRRGLFTWKQDRKYLSGIALKIADKVSDGD